MRKQLMAGGLAALSTAGLLAVATPAVATPTPCGSNYPTAQPYSLTAYPRTATVSKNSIVGTRGTLRRGTDSCEGYTLGFYRKYADEPTYTLHGGGITDRTGSVYVSVKARLTFRFFYNLRLNSTTSVRSNICEIKAV